MMHLKWTFWEILGHFRHFGTIRMTFDEFGAFKLFSQSFPTIFTRY